MDFKLPYDSAKLLLNVFYNCKYNEAIGYIELLHNLKEDGSEITLKEKIVLENALAAKETALREE